MAVSQAMAAPPLSALPQQRSLSVLFVAGWLPCPPDNGSRIRIYHLLKALGERHRVSVVASDPDLRCSIEEAQAALPFCRVAGVFPAVPYRPARLRALRGLLSATPRSIVDTHNAPLQRAIDDELGRRRYDVVVGSQWAAGAYLPRGGASGLVLDEVELGVFYQQYSATTNPLQRLRYYLTWQKMARYMGGLAAGVDACTVVSAIERDLLAAVAPHARIEIVPNGVDIAHNAPARGKPQGSTLIYPGALTYTANRDAMEYFVRDILPRIRAARPETRLEITGRYEGVDTAVLAAVPGVTLTGYVPDIRPLVQRARVCVAPLRLGGGTRLKILEAMALGTPVVATSKGAEGLAVTGGEDILLADDAATFAAQTLRLLADDDLHRRLSVAGRRLVEERYSWAAIGAELARLAADVAAVRRPA